MQTIFSTAALMIAVIAIFAGLYLLKSKYRTSFNFRVLTAMIVGLVFGAVVHMGFGSELTSTVYYKLDGTSVEASDTIVMPAEGTTIADIADSVEGLDVNELISTTGFSETQQIAYNTETNELLVVGETSTISGNIVNFLKIFSGIYINFLRLVVIPLILVSLSVAIIESKGREQLGKKVAKTIGILTATVAIAALVGVASVMIFQIDGAQIVESQLATATSAISSTQATISEKAVSLTSMSIGELIVQPFPKDFSFLVGQGSTAALSTVIFALFLGRAVLQIEKRNPKKVESFIAFLMSSKEVVLSMVREILKMTPFGIFALMATFMVTSSLSSLQQLLMFVIATYAAIIVMYLIHLVIIAILGLNPIKFAKKTWPVLLFGFSSRSSMAALSMNVETQIEELGVDETSANLSASFGATIGQNGCAGIYPAMVAMMAMSVTGQEVTIGWIIMLVLVIAISSFGIAGVGGGATFAAIAVLSIMGLPVTVAAVLIAVEPILDMARTALNISDAMVSGVAVSRIDKQLKTEVYNK